MELILNIACGLIPLLYLLIYVAKENKKKKKRNYLYGFVTAIVIALILIVVRLLILNVLPTENKEQDNTTTTTTTEVTTEETTTKTTEATTKVTTKATSNYNYEKILNPSGGEILGNTSKGYEVKKVNGLYYVDGYLVANKTYDLPENYNPGNLNSTVKAAADQMFAAAKNEKGFNMWAQSGFRSYATQKSIYNRYVNNDGKANADRYSARPGHSEHQTGLAFDVCASNKPCITNGFDNTEEAKWLSENAYKYGFILRYGKGKEDETGYMYESWHFRYVGKELAEKLYNNGNWITLESYFGLTSSYDSKPVGE